MTYQEAKESLGKQISKKLANNTYLRRVDKDKIVICLHETNILTFQSNGIIVVRTGGWHTLITKDRINEYLPEPFRIYPKKRNWYWSGHNYFGDVPFTEGDKIKNGMITPQNLY